MTDQQFGEFIATLTIAVLLSAMAGFILGYQVVFRRRIRDRMIASVVGTAAIPLLIGSIEFLVFRLWSPAFGRAAAEWCCVCGGFCGAVGGGFGVSLGGHFLRLRERDPEEAARVTHVVSARPQRGQVSVQTVGPPRYSRPMAISVPPQVRTGAAPGSRLVVSGSDATGDKKNYERGQLIAYGYYLVAFVKIVTVIGAPGFDLTKSPWWERLGLAVAPFAGPALLWCLVRRRWPALGRGLLEQWAPKGFVWLIIYGLGYLVVSLSGYR